MTDLTQVKISDSRIAPGVYFGLPDTAYHADAGLGSGSVRQLAVCPMYFWRDSAMNPFRPADDDTKSLLLGRALHKLVLEGREAFEAEYTVTPEVGDFAGCLVTADDIKAALRDAGEKVSGNKPDLIARLKAARPDAVIFDDLMTEHMGRCADAGMTTLKRSVFEAVVAAAAHISGNPRLAPAFMQGRPEISIFWERDGVPLKARIDYLRLGKNRSTCRWVGLASDLKSFSNQRAIAPEQAVNNAVAEYRLGMQAAQYLDGLSMIPEFVRSGKVYGAENVNPKWMEALASLGSDDFLWHWVFFQTDAPVAMLREAKPGLVADGRRRVADALNTYREHAARYGTDWRYTDPMPDKGIDMGDMPAWFANAA